MKLSIVIVSYNEKEFLSYAIDSCMNQKHNYSYEIIIGDDGSSDGSIEIIEEYAKKFPKIISYFVMDRSNTVNIIPSLRVSNVLKRAFSCSLGEYITVLSGDDINLVETRFKTQIDFLENNKKYKSCYIDFKKFWNNGNEQLISMRASLKESIFWSSQYMHISCFVFERKCLSNLLDRYCDDTGLIFSILKTGKSKHLNLMGFGYRQRDVSIMHESDKLELNLLELSLYQDCLNKGGMERSSLSRFSRPLKYVFEHKKELHNSKYAKYLDNCSIYPNDMIAIVGGEGEKSALKIVRNAKIYASLFRILRKANMGVNMILRK